MMENISQKGVIDLTILHKDGRVEHRHMTNRVLRSGRMAIASTLSNEFGASFQYFITGMSFGSGGTVGGVPRYIDDTVMGLFGPTIITKPVISSVDPLNPVQATFTSVLTFDDAVGNTINEMALQFSDGITYYSMSTFADLNKGSNLQLTFNWQCTML